MGRLSCRPWVRQFWPWLLIGQRRSDGAGYLDWTMMSLWVMCISMLYIVPLLLMRNALSNYINGRTPLHGNNGEREWLGVGLRLMVFGPWTMVVYFILIPSRSSEKTARVFQGLYRYPWNDKILKLTQNCQLLLGQLWTVLLGRHREERLRKE